MEFWKFKFIFDCLTIDMRINSLNRLKNYYFSMGKDHESLLYTMVVTMKVTYTSNIIKFDVGFSTYDEAIS